MTTVIKDREVQRRRRQEHGHTTAAWTTVAVLIVGWTVGGVAFVMAQPWGVALAALIMVAGLIVGKVMSMAGFGSLPGWQEEMPEGETPFEGAD